MSTEGGVGRAGDAGTTPQVTPQASQQVMAQPDGAENGVTPLVVIGASAGGVEALATVVGTLPAEFGAPVVIAQHLDPRRPSRLGEILQRRTALRVMEVEGRERLRPGTIYVLPADRDAEIGRARGEGGEGEVEREGDAKEVVAVADDGGAESSETLGVRHAKPSIDRLLRSAAAACGEGVVAVVLSGSGTDGAQGTRAVKEAGGTVVVQNPRTASFPGMPQAVAPAAVDMVAELETIGPLLRELVEAPRTPREPSEERAMRAVLEQLRERSGIDFTTYKAPTIMRRLQRRLVATGVRQVAEYARFLQRNPAEYERLVSSFLIKVTGFFRDPDLYAHLREHVVPDLIAQARERGNELRVWSAGCATGEEAYGLAMLLVDALGEELDRFTVRVFATDLDNDAIGFARRGVYPAAALGNVPPEVLERHFAPVGDGQYEIRKRVRALTVFGQHDLGQRAPFPRIDLALCRNVLIYFTTELQRRALQLFAFALREGGYLVLGKAETVSPLAEYFSAVDSGLKVYRRQGTRPVSIPAARIRDVAPLVPPRPAPVGGGVAAGGGGGARTLAAPALLEGGGRGGRGTVRARGVAERLEGLLMQLPVGVVVVDRRYDVQLINGAARLLLGIHGSAIGEDFVHLTQSAPPAALRGAIDQAFKRPAPSPATRAAGQTTASHLGERGGMVVLAEPADGEARQVQVSAYPYRMDAEEEGLVLVLIQDVTAHERSLRELRQERERLAAEVARLDRQVERLAQTNEQLLAANQELAATNAALRSSNEELLLSHEEAQATTEEVETLNEELQATVEELNTTNDDLQSRSVELQELAETLEAEREQLRAVLATMSDAVLVVDAVGRVVLANEAFDRLFAEAARLERPLEGLERDAIASSGGQAESLMARVGRAEPFVARLARVGGDGRRREYEARGRPMVGERGAQGSVITIRELDE